MAVIYCNLSYFLTRLTVIRTHEKIINICKYINIYFEFCNILCIMKKYVSLYRKELIRGELYNKLLAI